MSEGEVKMAKKKGAPEKAYQSGAEYEKLYGG